MSRWVTADNGVFLAVANEMPSSPTWISVTWVTPLDMHSLASDAFILREAFSTSGKRSPTPAQNSFMPAPVPVDSMIGVPSLGLARPIFSLTMRANG